MKSLILFLVNLPGILLTMTGLLTCWIGYLLQTPSSRKSCDETFSNVIVKTFEEALRDQSKAEEFVEYIKRRSFLNS